MVRYLVRRLLRSVFLLLAVSVVSFCLFELAPGDYFDDLRLDPDISKETIAALRKQHGLDGSPVSHYVGWMASVFRGEWGFSVAYNSPAGPLLFSRARNTLVLTASAAMFTWAIAIPFAVWAAVCGTWRTRLANFFVFVLLSLPELLVILLLMSIAAYWKLFPAGGMTSLDFEGMTLWGKIRDIALHSAVPVSALVLASLPSLFLHTRTALVEALNSPFVRFAEANGIPLRRIVVRHALPAAANPMVSLFGLSIGTLLSSSLLVESVAGWPGLGQLLLQALLHRDRLVVAGAVMLSSVFLVSGNLLADLLLYACDPRIREGR